MDKNRHSCTRFPYIFVHVVLKKTQGKLKLFLCENHNQTKEKWIEYYDCKILKCINFWYKILVLGGLFLLTLKMFGGIKNVNPNVKVIHFFASKESQINFTCQHCSLEFFFTSFMAPNWPLFFLTNIEGWMPSRFFEEKICQKTMPYECVRNCNYFPCERKIMIMIQFFFCWFKKYVCISKWGQKLTKIASN